MPRFMNIGDGGGGDGGGGGGGGGSGCVGSGAGNGSIGRVSVGQMGHFFGWVTWFMGQCMLTHDPPLFNQPSKSQ